MNLRTRREVEALLMDGMRERRKQFGRPSRVYFAQLTEGGPIKIGCSEDVPRLRVHNQHALFDRHLLYLGDVPGSFRLERRWHNLFWQHREAQEWFRPDPFVEDTVRFALLTAHIWEQRRLPYGMTL